MNVVNAILRGVLFLGNMTPPMGVTSWARPSTGCAARSKRPYRPSLTYAAGISNTLATLPGPACGGVNVRVLNCESMIAFAVSHVALVMSSNPDAVLRIGHFCIPAQIRRAVVIGIAVVVATVHLWRWPRPDERLQHQHVDPSISFVAVSGEADCQVVGWRRSERCYLGPVMATPRLTSISDAAVKGSNPSLI